MLKRTTALVFVSLLSSVAGEESFQENDNPHYDGLPFFVSTVKEMCLNHFDPVSCQYLDSIRYRIIDSKSQGTKPIELNPDNRTTETSDGLSQEEVSIEIPIIDRENHLHKRFTVFRRKNPTGRGYKRGPGFRSWGGKRDMTLSGPNLEKRSRFASWGGKRDGELFPDEDEPQKGSKFQDWGEKKSTDDFRVEPEKRWRRMYLSEPFKKHVPKRPQFQSWGGKRGSSPWHDFFDFLHPPPRFSVGGGEKRIFSSWGGKRFDDDVQSGNERLVDSKGRFFQSWGGKRVAEGVEGESKGVKKREAIEGEIHFGGEEGKNGRR